MLGALDGKVSLVTGAGSGIGRGLAEALAARRMCVVATDISNDALADTAAALKSNGQPYIALPLDVRDPAKWAALDAAMGRDIDADAAQNICENEAVALAGYRAAAGQYEGEGGQ